MPRCPKCKAEVSTPLDGGAVRCANCGAVLKRPTKGQGPLSATEGATEPQPSPNGVGGWLLFFCVWLTILTPLNRLRLLAGTWLFIDHTENTWPLPRVVKRMEIFEALAPWAVVIYGFIVGCMIWGGHRNGRTLARQYLIISFFSMFVLSMAVLVMMIVLLLLPVNPVSSMVHVFRELPFFVVWWLYFEKSRRVRNTYGE